MIAVITGDIIASRKLLDQDQWLIPFKSLLATWGQTPRDWMVDRGDFFQIEVSNPETAFHKALQIKAVVKNIPPLHQHKKTSTIDVRMAIGIGDKSYSGDRISESNGSAFVNAGEKFDRLKKENTTLAIQSPWEIFNQEINLYLKLASTFLDKWTVSSAELAQIVLANPKITQEEIGKLLGIKQNSVSGRWNRAHINEILAVEKTFREKVKNLENDYTS